MSLFRIQGATYKENGAGYSLIAFVEAVAPLGVHFTVFSASGRVDHQFGPKYAPRYLNRIRRIDKKRSKR